MKLLNRLKARLNQKKELKNLQKLNFVFAGLYFVQALLIAVFAADYRLPLSTSFLTHSDTTKQLEAASQRLVDLPVSWLVIAFLLIGALTHLSLATICRTMYEKDLKGGLNKPRWYGFGFSAAVLVTAVSLLVGIFDISLLVALFVLTLVMHLMGLAMETYGQQVKKPVWLSYVVGTIAGVTVGLVTLWFIVGNGVYGSGHLPGYTLWLYLTMLIYFVLFAGNAFMQYKEQARWADYLFNDRAFAILVFVAQSAVAWQIFAAVLK